MDAYTRVYATTPIETFDRPHSDPDSAPGRIVGFRIDTNLTVYLGLRGGDTETIAVCDRLVGALQELRDNAARRMAEHDDVGRILAETMAP